MFSPVRMGVGTPHLHLRKLVWATARDSVVRAPPLEVTMASVTPGRAHARAHQ